MASNVIRWLIYFSIAICTAAVGVFIDTVIEYFCNWKYQSIRHCIDVKHSMAECLIIWLLFTVLPTIVGCCVVLFMEVNYNIILNFSSVIKHYLNVSQYYIEHLYYSFIIQRTIIVDSR